MEQNNPHPTMDKDVVDSIATPQAVPVTPILKYFGYAHLPEVLQVVSKPFGELAEKLDTGLANGPEKSVALRKLLESKDAAVRAALG